MKKIVILLVAAWSLFNVSLRAQNCDILLIPYIQDNIDPLPDETRSYLETKLTQIITQNGIGTDEGFGQFYLTSKFAVLNKDVIAGSPQMISQRISVTLYLFDYFGEKVIETSSFEIQAAGTNENKLYINAIRNIKPENEKIQDFVKTGKKKILNYYNTNYEVIIKKSQTLASMKNYEEALFYLTSVPECSQGYDKAVAACKSIYHAYIDNLCQRTLLQARTAWAAQPNAAGAAEAGIYLNNIEPDAACYKDAQALYSEIKSSVKEDWKFEFKNYDERALERARIEAYRQVGVAWGKGQKPSSIIIGKLR